MKKTQKLEESCGVFGIRCKEDDKAPTTVYYGLLALQHRGQEGAGIALLNGTSILHHKDLGLVSEVFSPDVLARMPRSRMAIGHVRYSTTGSNNRSNTQPIITEYLTGRIATAHNGNLVNISELREKLQKIGYAFTATNDSEMISSLIAYEDLQCRDIEMAVERACKQFVGSFSLIILSGTGKLIAVRDGWGIRPLCIGVRGEDYVVCSESCALDGTGFSFLRDVQPGEMVVIDRDQPLRSKQILPSKKNGFCIFEYVYFARSDSIIDGQSVYNARFQMGVELAKEHPVEADVVCGVPDSGLDAAAGYAFQSGLPLKSGFVKNRYVARSFIAPTQAQRSDTVRLKLNPLRANIEGKRVVLVDDSIVRGTTSARIIRSLKQAGAKEVHMMISSPPFRHTCHLGTDIDREEALIANQRTLPEIAEEIGADSLGYISIDGMKRACKDAKVSFCTGCFNHDYPVDNGNNHKDILDTQ